MSKYLLLCLLWMGSLWAQEQEPLLMAVIDVQLQGDAKKYMNEQERRYLSTAIRAQASRILGTQVEILAQDKFKKLVKASGEGCSEAGCLAGFFKEIGVDLGVQPTVSYAFGELKLLLEAADKRASLASRVYSAQANEKGKNLMGKQVERLAEELFREVAIKLNLHAMGGGGEIEANPEPKPRPSRTNNELSLTLQAQVASLVLTAVQGENDIAAEIWVDGKQVGNTPKTVKVPLVGQVELRFEGENQRVNLGGIAEGQKKTLQVEFTAKPKAGDGMVAIPAGCFNMGSNDGDDDEKPVHRVCLSAFSMDKYEVTMADYTRVMGTRPWAQCSGEYCTTPSDQLPAYYVDWNEASSYCQKIGKRLPTEAEFEYANRAGSTSKFPWGNDENSACRYANVGDASAKRKWSSWTTFGCDDGYAMLAPVGSFAANPWGLYDMAGNVWEWTSDWYGSYGSSSEQDPRGASSGSYRVLRGGVWGDFPSYLRSASRNYNEPGGRINNLGFRCVAPVSK